MFNAPKNNSRFFWTEHSKMKMRQYGIGPGKVRSVISSPDRKEEGIVPKTVAVMKKAGSSKNPYEIWVMYQIKIKSQISNLKSDFNLGQIKVISAWKYPGVSPRRNPIPDEILMELENIL